MNTQQQNNNFTGILLVLFVAWLLFGNGLQVVFLLTQQAQQRLVQQQLPLVITLPTANIAQPTQAAGVQPDPNTSGQIAPLTLDVPPASAPEVPAQVEQPAVPQPTLEPTSVLLVAEQSAPPAAQQQPEAPQPTVEVAGKPIVAAAHPVDSELIVTGNGSPDWAAMAAALPTPATADEAVQQALERAQKLHASGFKP